jgi:hypothetical protein
MCIENLRNKEPEKQSSRLYHDLFRSSNRQPMVSMRPWKLPSRRSMSFSTASTASSSSLPVALLSVVGTEKSCMKVSTHALSLERAYGIDRKTDAAVQAVAWSTVEIHSHEVILGDHPSVSSGPPFTIEWTAFESVTWTVAEYKSDECNNIDTESHHRFSSSGNIIIPNTVREAWLRHQGYSHLELGIATRAIHKIKEGRRSSARDLDRHGRGWSRLWSFRRCDQRRKYSGR